MPRSESPRKWAEDYDRKRTSPLPPSLYRDYPYETVRELTAWQAIKANYDVFLVLLLVASVIIIGGAVIIWWL